MTKDEALDLALEALEKLRTPLRVNTALDAYDVSRAITAIKQARSAPVQEPSGFFRHKDVCGDEVGHPTPYYLAPPAQPAPVQNLPFGVGGGLVAIKTLLSRDPCVHANTAIEMIDAILNAPAAQRQWVGLTDDEWQDLSDRYGMILFGRFKNEIETKLREKNTP